METIFNSNLIKLKNPQTYLLTVHQFLDSTFLSFLILRIKIPENVPMTVFFTKYTIFYSRRAPLQRAWTGSFEKRNVAKGLSIVRKYYFNLSNGTEEEENQCKQVKVTFTVSQKTFQFYDEGQFTQKTFSFPISLLKNCLRLSFKSRSRILWRFFSKWRLACNV